MAVRNTLLDLNDHLFAQMERLDVDGMTPEQLDMEINRARAMSNVAAQIINNANVVLNAERFRDEKLDANTKVPRMLTGDGD